MEKIIENSITHGNQGASHPLWYANEIVQLLFETGREKFKKS